MASKFLRRQQWWIKFRHPKTGQLCRESLHTHDEVRAELLRARVDVELQLLKPRIQNVTLPDHLSRLLLKEMPPAPVQSLDPTPASPVRVPEPSTARPNRTTVNEAASAYLRFVRSENASAHVANKVSIFRRFLGDKRIEEIGGPANCARRASSTDGAVITPLFTGIYLDEITVVLVQEFIESLNVGRDTMRHYRQCFHHWFSFCLKLDLYQPTNWHSPNPMSGLLGYATKNRAISFLTEQQITEQLVAVQDHPSIQMGAAIMIYAGLRLSEALWLTKESISSDLTFISVRNRVDKEEDVAAL